MKKSENLLCFTSFYNFSWQNFPSFFLIRFFCCCCFVVYHRPFQHIFFINQNWVCDANFIFLGGWWFIENWGQRRQEKCRVFLLIKEKKGFVNIFFLLGNNVRTRFEYFILFVYGILLILFRFLKALVV